MKTHWSRAHHFSPPIFLSYSRPESRPGRFGLGERDDILFGAGSMAWASAKRMIDAPVEEVFNTVAHIEAFRNALPHIIDVEFLTDQQIGAGTRFRETRLMNGKQYVTELEITEYEPHARVRMVTDTNGTIWDTLYTIDRREGNTRLELQMDAKAHELMAKLVNHFIQGLVQHAIDRDMDLVQKYCEDNANHRSDRS